MTSFRSLASASYFLPLLYVTHICRRLRRRRLVRLDAFDALFFSRRDSTCRRRPSSSSSSSSSLSHQKRPYRGVTVRLGRPLTAITRLASLPCRTLRHGSRLKTCIVDVQRFVLSSFLSLFYLSSLSSLSSCSTRRLFDAFPSLD